MKSIIFLLAAGIFILPAYGETAPEKDIHAVMAAEEGHGHSAAKMTSAMNPSMSMMKTERSFPCRMRARRRMAPRRKNPKRRERPRQRRKRTPAQRCLFPSIRAAAVMMRERTAT